MLDDTVSSTVPKTSSEVFVTAAKETGLDPRYIAAHAALESGWGNSNFARNRNNYFGQ